MICQSCMDLRHSRCRGCGCNICDLARQGRRRQKRSIKKGDIKKTPTLTPEQRERNNAAARRRRAARQRLAEPLRLGRKPSYSYEQARMVPDLRAMGYSQYRVAEMLGLGATPDSGRQMVRRIENGVPR